MRNLDFTVFTYLAKKTVWSAFEINDGMLPVICHRCKSCCKRDS